MNTWPSILRLAKSDVSDWIYGARVRRENEWEINAELTFSEEMNVW
jgi:hypothetical protein